MPVSVHGKVPGCENGGCARETPTRTTDLTRGMRFIAQFESTEWRTLPAVNLTGAHHAFSRPHLPQPPAGDVQADDWPDRCARPAARFPCSDPLGNERGDPAASRSLAKEVPGPLSGRRGLPLRRQAARHRGDCRFARASLRKGGGDRRVHPSATTCTQHHGQRASRQQLVCLWLGSDKMAADGLCEQLDGEQAGRRT